MVTPISELLRRRPDNRGPSVTSRRGDGAILPRRPTAPVPARRQLRDAPWPARLPLPGPERHRQGTKKIPVDTISRDPYGGADGRDTYTRATEMSKASQPNGVILY